MSHRAHGRRWLLLNSTFEKWKVILRPPVGLFVENALGSSSSSPSEKDRDVFITETTPRRKPGHLACLSDFRPSIRRCDRTIGGNVLSPIVPDRSIVQTRHPPGEVL